MKRTLSTFRWFLLISEANHKQSSFICFLINWIWRKMRRKRDFRVFIRQIWKQFSLWYDQRGLHFSHWRNWIWKMAVANVTLSFKVASVATHATRVRSIPTMYSFHHKIAIFRNARKLNPTFDSHIDFESFLQFYEIQKIKQTGNEISNNFRQNK